MEATNRRTDLTPLEQKHTDLMQRLAGSLADTPSVLKGGTALMLSYGLDRFSEDLDFDSTKALNLEKRINDAADKEGIKIESIRLKKDTDTTKRYVVFYESEHGAGRLKIETSLRADVIPEDQTTTVNGIKTYKVENLVSQKLEALEGRSKVRDLYDINFLADKYPEAFTKAQAEKLSSLTQDPDYLSSRFKADHSGDNILKSQSLDSLVLSTQYNAESLQERASNRVAAQDFLKMDQGDFIKKHPDLTPHVAAVSAIEKKLASEPMTDKQRQTAMQRVRENAANSIQEGVKPDIKLKTQTQNLKNDLSR